MHLRPFFRGSSGLHMDRVVITQATHEPLRKARDGSSLQLGARVSLSRRLEPTSLELETSDDLTGASAPTKE